MKWDVKQFSRRSALLMWLHDWTRRNEAPTKAEVDAGVERFADYVEELKQMNRSRRFAVVIVPDPNQLRGAHVSERVDDHIEAICEEAGVPVLRLLEAARRADRGGMTLPVVPYDGHFNAEANEAMARAVAEWLKRWEGEALAEPSACEAR